MAGPANDPSSQSAIERFRDTYNQPAANGNDGYFKVPNRTPPPPPPFSPPKPQKIVENSYSREQRFGQGFTSGRSLKDNPGFRNPISANQGNLPTSGGGQSLAPQAPITRAGGAAGFASGIGQNVVQGVAQQGPNYLNPSNPNGIFAPDPRYVAAKKSWERQSSLPPGFSMGPKGSTPNPLSPDFWNPLNPISPFNERSPFHPFDVFGKEDMWEGHRRGDNYYPDEQMGPQQNFKEMGPLSPNSVRAPNATGNAPRNTNLPPWLDPFKDTSKTGESIPENSGKPNAESKRWFPRPTLIRVWSPNNGRYVTIGALSYSVTEVPKHLYSGPPPVLSARNSNFTYLRDGKDGYTIEWTYVKSTNPVEIGTGSIVIEPWTLQNLGPNPAETTPNPGVPENRIPETNQPFFPPLPKYLDDVAQPYPPTILDPNDFRSPKNQPLSPMFPPELAPIPKPLDPLQKPETPLAPGTQPTKPPEDDTVPKVPPLPFNPLQSPAPPNPIQDPPPFEPGPVNPNQRLNDRGIFPATKATITPTVSGSPLSPDVEIGGDPVRLVPPSPKITKPPTTTAPETPEQKKKDEERTLPFPLLPPIFPKPTGPTGTIDPQTADDITKSKNPPPPPVGTKPKCQDGCMAGLETGQQSILDKLNGNGNGLNVGLNAAELGLLNTINNKMGEQLIGGLAGKLTRFSKWMQFDRIMNVFILIGVLHNAAMLSRSAAETIGELTSQALTVIGIKGDDNQPIDVNEIIGKQANVFMSSILGETVWNGTKESWQKANRIISTASNIISTVRSIADSTRDVMEWTAENTGKIGNALKRWRVVGENAYKWMPERVTAQGKWHRSIDKAVEGIQSVEDAASSLAGAVGNVRSIQEDFTEVKEQKANFDKALKEATPKSGTENDATKAKATAEKAASASPVLAVTDRAKGDAP
ncbi:hypothetical protein C7B65_22760 [Phormidesmis priestleyi ULC007]|uniref:Uncharacterized protein n=1 Tax=Phormidesmis priestleyi ULC007 TaxID=1920490 RepID=A0A2T1D6E9_9CYAN|nr:hypothetical protein [Phormidesmis priestleyi]PSB16049.1 hypothetical protein C7B65_22760 [Phormidesmis priestleyi ULC007]PZO52245.1 MAG: hypothetical protein DCF14_07210 [Phormidesmis priestleyi]